MQAIHWRTEIPATWKRALDLKDIRLADGGLVVEVEEESGKRWFLEFKTVQAWKVTSEECAGNIVSELPAEGALFVIQQSGWLRQLGDTEPLKRSQHFVICCYDEIVEVLAWDCLVTTTMKWHDPCSTSETELRNSDLDGLVTATMK